ncbi:MAG TPA: PH domain-containing protein [Haliangiales bacterium]|nr:PH domain-containing protein [Haliangiales bacterium]
MYELLKKLIFPLLKVRETQPSPPAGSHDTFQVFRACPAFLSYTLFFWKLYVVILAFWVVVVSVVLLVVSPWFILLVVPLVLVAAFKAAVFYATTRLNYDMRWYVITERSLLIREGVWIAREITLTFANAQNVRITQGPLQRLFGFSNVEVDTAGGGGGNGRHHGEGARPHRAALRGLDNATFVRDLILEHLRRHRTAGLGDPDDRAGAGRKALDPELLREILEEAKTLRTALVSAQRT